MSRVSRPIAGLLEECETGLSIAQSAGGDRVVTWKAIECEIEKLRGEIESQISQLDDSRGAADAIEAWGSALVEQLGEVFAEEENPSKAVMRVGKRMVDLVVAQIAELKALPLNNELEERLGEIDLLERRVRKLTSQLDQSEAEIKRLASMKVVDDGIASVYRSVQGLSDDEDNAEQKKEMLAGIFTANLALRQQSS